jgi:SnoaL-like domain
MTSNAVTPVATWHQLMENKNPSGIAAILADDATFYSPVVHTPQVGKAITNQYLVAAFHVFYNERFHYIREIIGVRDAVLEFETTIDDIQINGVDMIKWNEHGLITEFKVMLRPLKAVHLIHQKMGDMLAQFKSV